MSNVAIANTPNPTVPASVSQCVLDCFAAQDRHHSALTEFAGVLQLFFESSTLRGRFDHFFLLMRWLGKSDAGIPLPEGDDEQAPRARDPRWRRSHVFRAIIIKSAPLRARLAASLGTLVAETTCVSFFAESGLPQKHGFFGEAAARAVGWLIPSPRDDDDMEQQLRRLYRNAKKAQRFGEIPQEMFHELVEALALADHQGVWDPGVQALNDALTLLAARIQGLGLSQVLRIRGSFSEVPESPFFKLPRCTDELLKRLKEGTNADDAKTAFHETIVACHVETRAISRRLESTGISVTIVFALETIEKCLRRMEVIGDVMTLPAGAARSNVLHGLIANCISATFEDTSLRGLLSSNLHLLAKKIVERVGHTGEHYIARNMKEYGWMWLAAAGGGILTVATASFKMRIIGAQLAPLQEGFLAALNYSISFIVLVACGLALATKQPAMTGARLANILREHTGRDRLDRIIDAFMLICRSQLAAAVANVIFVAAGCVALEHLWVAMFNRPFLSEHETEHVVTSLNPLASGTIFFAAITGAVLFLSSLVGGWIENWSVYNRLPQAIADHRIGATIGARYTRRLAQIWEHNIAGWSTCIALGVMLGLVPEIGRVVGIPLDVRHVTLSSGTLALAAASHPNELPEGALAMACAGIAVTFVLNLTVSFAMAFATAVRAYGFPRKEMYALIRRTAERLGERPFDFILPISWPATVAPLPQQQQPAITGAPVLEAE